MERLEDELKRSLEQREPSPDFTDRVMSRVRTARRWQWPLWSWSPWQWSPMLRWGLAGALAASLLAGIFLQQRQARIERQRAEAARDQLVLSLQIASAKFNKAREAVLRVSKENSL